MNLIDVIFVFFALVTVGSAAIVVFSKNIIYSAFSLLFTFFGVAGLYVLLSADFLAVTQLLIYIGGILILLLFGVMLTNKAIDVEMKTGTMQTLPAAILTSMLAGVLCGLFWVTDWRVVSGGPDIESTTAGLGELFMTKFLLPFEIASIVLLVAMIGAAMIARRDKAKNTNQ